MGIFKALFPTLISFLTILKIKIKKQSSYYLPGFSISKCIEEPFFLIHSIA
jgi:hypothetical protein